MVKKGTCLGLFAFLDRRVNNACINGVIVNGSALVEFLNCLFKPHFCCSMKDYQLLNRFPRRKKPTFEK